MELSIVIGTYNRLALLQKCLVALEQGVHVAREIILVDGGSTDGTLEYLENFPGVRLVRDGGLVGQAKSLNRVFRSLSSDYVCWLSDDNIVVEGALDKVVGILKNNPVIGMVALKIKDITGPYVDDPYLGGIWESGILNCNQGMLPVKLLHQLGGFDEEFRDYGIDIDLTTRVLLAGYKVVYTKQMAIQHYRDYETDNWITKSNREQRQQSARELYRSRYAMLLRKDRLASKPTSSKSDSPPQGSPALLVYLYEKLVKHFRIIYYKLVKHIRMILHPTPSNSDSPPQGSPTLLVYLYEKLVKHYRIIYYKLIKYPRMIYYKSVKHIRTIYYKLVKYIRMIYYKLVKYIRMILHAFNILLSEAVVARRKSAFFRDLYNIRKGRFISRWDLLENYFNTYYLVQEIPNTIRKQMQEPGHPAHRNG